MKTFILFGKKLLPDNTLSWIGEARCEKAMELLKAFSKSKLIITGGKTTSVVSEASAMKSYIIERIPDRNIVLEEKSESSIHQLCILKTDYLLVQNIKEVGLITDETHMPRLALVASKIFGDNIKIVEYPARVKISGVNRKLIEDYEQKLYDLTKTNPVYTEGKSGDHLLWLNYDKFYRDHRRKNPESDIDINKAFLDYLKSTK